MKYLQRERVYFRPLEKEDLPLLHKWLNDPKIRRVYGEVFPRTVEKEWLETMYDDKSKIWFALALNERYLSGYWPSCTGSQPRLYY